MGFYKQNTKIVPAENEKEAIKNLNNDKSINVASILDIIRVSEYDFIQQEKEAEHLKEQAKKQQEWNSYLDTLNRLKKESEIK